MNIKLRAACALPLLAILPACSHKSFPYTPAQIRDTSVEIKFKPGDEKRMTILQQMALAQRARDGVVLDCYNNDAPCRAALAQNPDNFEAHMGMAMWHRNKRHQDIGAAMREYREVVRLKPNYGSAWMMLASGLAGTGKKEEAIKIYKKMAATNDETGRAAKKHLKRLTGK